MRYGENTLLVSSKVKRPLFFSQKLRFANTGELVENDEYIMKLTLMFSP